MTLIHVFEHESAPAEPDVAQQHLTARGAEVRVHRCFEGAPVPSLDGAAGLIVLGGIQMVTDADDLPWMRAEQAVQREAMARGLPSLNICLGAQMLADALGARVAPHPQGKAAWGVYELTALPAEDNPVPPRLTALAGNLQGFDLPQGAERLATRDVWPNQAFRIGPALGLQFHPEATRPIFGEWLRLGAEMHAKEGAQDRQTMQARFDAHQPAAHAWLRGLLDRMFNLV
ncbi:MAG: type 1 glutamine amidotransferase [Pseudomonadota bacterium]